MKILFITSSLPTLPGQAGSIRPFKFAEAFSSQHDVILASISSKESYKQYIGIDVINKTFSKVVNLPNEKKTNLFRRALHSVLQKSHLDYSLKYPKFQKTVQSKISDLVRVENPDVIFVDRLEATLLIPNNLKTIVMADLCDSLSLLYKRQAMSESNLISRLKLNFEAKALKNLELQCLKKIDRAVFISKVDSDYLKSNKSIVIPNACECPENMPRQERNPNTLIFTGVMSYSPNVDAAIYLANKLLPILKTNNPDAKLKLVGGKPSKEVKNLEANDIEVTGFVESLTPYLETSGIYVSPLRFGAGMKYKILEAMAHGIPVVASSISVDGIEVEDNEHFLLANNEKEFVEKINLLISDNEKRKELSVNAFNLVREKYSWEAFSKSALYIL